MLLAHHETPMLPLADSVWDWFRAPSSTTAQQVDNLFWGITVVNAIFFVLIVALMAIFVVKYRKRPGHKAEHSPHHNNTLEALWSLIPLLLVLVIFYFGFTGYLNMRVPPDNAYEINVKAFKWGWSFNYPNGAESNNLHVPVDRPVKLVLSSDDVIHSLYIPAFRVKMDCVPGRYNTMWFQATEPSKPDNGDGEFETGEGGYDLFCTEYCGTGHSTMLAKVHVYPTEADFVNALEELNNVRDKGTPAEVGAQLYVSKACKTCHSIDGVDRPAGGGPSFKGHYGKEVTWAPTAKSPNIQRVKMDENYIRESILNPMAKIRAGYQSIMPVYKGRLSEDELFALIAYIKQLNGADVPDWLPLEGEEGEGESAEGEAAETPAGEAATDKAPADQADEDEAADDETTDEAKTAA